MYFSGQGGNGGSGCTAWVKTDTGFSPITKIVYGNATLDIEEYVTNALKKLSRKPIYQHKCHNCGATVEIDENKHIFICKYCDSVYAIGTELINS